MAAKGIEKGLFCHQLLCDNAAMKKAKARAEKPEEFARFERFTKALMAVPKKEIDAQKAKYEKQKTARKKKAA